MFDYSDLVISNIVPLASCYSLFLKILFFLFFFNQSTVSEWLQLQCILRDIYYTSFWCLSQELFCLREPRPPLFTTQRYWSHYEIQINTLIRKVPGLEQIGI